MTRSIPLLVALATLAAGCAKMGKHETTGEVVRETSVVREGTVAAIDRDRLLFWDADNPTGQPLALKLTEDTTVVAEGDFVDRGALEEGGAVRVFYDETDERPEALRVEILGGDEADAVKDRVEEATAQ